MKKKEFCDAISASWLRRAAMAPLFAAYASICGATDLPKKPAELPARTAPPLALPGKTGTPPAASPGRTNTPASPLPGKSGMTGIIPGRSGTTSVPSPTRPGTPAVTPSGGASRPQAPVLKNPSGGNFRREGLNGTRPMEAHLPSGRASVSRPAYVSRQMVYGGHDFARRTYHVNGVVYDRFYRGYTYGGV